MVTYVICSDRILTCRIKSICSPAKVGLVVTDLITSPVVSWRGWETPPPPAPWLSCHSLLNHGGVKTSCCVWTAFVSFVYIWWSIGCFDTDENEYYFLFILFVSYVI